MQTKPGKLVFGCDIIINTPYIANWEDIKLHKKKKLDKKNRIENTNHKPHINRIRDKLLVC